MKKILQSRDIKVEKVEEEFRPPRKGPATGAELVLDDAGYIKLYASPAELREFRSKVESRLAKDQAAPRTLPDGTRISGHLVLAICDRCGRASWVEPTNEAFPCVGCNWNRLKNGGMMRLASRTEAKEWFEAEEARLAKWRADAPRRERERASAGRQRIYAEGLGAPATDIFRRRP